MLLWDVTMIDTIWMRGSRRRSCEIRFEREGGIERVDADRIQMRSGQNLMVVLRIKIVAVVVATHIRIIRVLRTPTSQVHMPGPFPFHRIPTINIPKPDISVNTPRLSQRPTIIHRPSKLLLLLLLLLTPAPPLAPTRPPPPRSTIRLSSRRGVLARRIRIGRKSPVRPIRCVWETHVRRGSDWLRVFTLDTGKRTFFRLRFS